MPAPSTPEIKTILCCLDFSEPAVKVAAHARLLAEKLGARVLALYVSPTMNRFADMYVSRNMIENLRQEIHTGAQKSMDAALVELFPGMAAAGLVEYGYAPVTIVEVAQRENADMIVMGTHGRKTVDKIIFGSVAEKVCKTSPIPVLLVRP